MKQSMRLDIYIATSAGRNMHAYQLLRERLAEAGHEILDWARLAPPLPSCLPPEERRRLMDADGRGEIFDFCSGACAGADLLIYLGPAGQDAACEVGMAYAAGVPVLGLRGAYEAPGTILYRAVREWHGSVDGLLAAVEDLAEETAEAGLAAERLLAAAGEAAGDTRQEPVFDVQGRVHGYKELPVEREGQC